jgi:hypothetical protein
MYLACTQFENSALLGYYAACRGKELPVHAALIAYKSAVLL